MVGRISKIENKGRSIEGLKEGETVVMDKSEVNHKLV
jgi:hypothetical protein